MPDKVGENAQKPRVLIAGHLPPPMGGIGVFFTFLLGSSLPNKVDLRFVITQSQRMKYASTGKTTLANLVSSAMDISRYVLASLQYRPQVCHIATAEGVSFVKHSVCVVISRLLGSCVLLHPHCSLRVMYSDRSTYWQWLVRNVIRLTDGVIALSEEWRALREIIPGCEVYTLPNGIDIAPYQTIARERLAQGERQGSLNVLYLGHIGKEKGSFDLIDAARIMQSQKRDVLFHIVGEEANPGELEKLKQKIESNGLSMYVLLHSPAYGQTKMDFFRLADIFVYPSFYEGMPMAIIEAMACGLPTIASRVGGIPDMIIEGANGYLTDPGRPDQIADVLNTLCADNQHRYAMRLQCAQIAAERFNIEDRVDRLVSIYQCAIAKTIRSRTGNSVTSQSKPDHLV